MTLVFAEQRLENKSPALNSSGSRGTGGADNVPGPRPEVPGAGLWAGAGRGLRGCRGAAERATSLQGYGKRPQPHSEASQAKDSPR